MCCLAAVPSCSRAQSRRARAVQAQGLEEILKDLRLLQPPAHKQSPVRSAGPAGLTHAVVGIVNKSGWKLPGRCAGFGWRGDFVAAHGTASPISVRPSYSRSFFLSCCWARGPSSRSPLSRWSELRPGRATALRCSRRRDSIRDQRQDPLPLLQGAALAALVGLGRRVPQSPPPVALRLTPRPLPNEASYHVKLGAYCSQVGLLVSLM